jgi:hypothetical protein
MPYKKGTERTVKGFQSISFTIMFSLQEQSMVPGAIVPYLCIQPHHLAPSRVEIITNKTTKLLNILAKQQTKISNVIYQNYLAFKYLLASEGSECGKVNLSNCCSQIDDEGKAIEEITNNNKMKKLAMFLCRSGRNGIPKTCLGDGSQP